MIALIFLCMLSFFCTVRGEYNPQDEKIIICGVGKNIEPYVAGMITKIEDLGARFKDYRVFIYENNSDDKTPGLLCQWARNNGKVTIISERLSSDELYQRTKAHALRDQAPNRMGLIAYARNQVLARAMGSAYDGFNFIFMTDLDFFRGWDCAGVVSSLALSQEWDALTANGIDSSRHYYDRYAYRDEDMPLGPELLGEYFWQDLYRTPFYIGEKSPLKKVYSAYGGAALYKREVLRMCWYSGYVTEQFKDYMSIIVNKKLSRTNKQYTVYKNTCGVAADLLPIIFQQNSGYDGPVVCEHSILHADMAMRGYDKIYVNPAMVCYY